jgi:hypothetical protein
LWNSMIGRHKFSVGKKFWSWKFSTFNNDIFGKFFVRGNFSWVEMGLKYLKNITRTSTFRAWSPSSLTFRRRVETSSSCYIYDLITIIWILL